MNHTSKRTKKLFLNFSQTLKKQWNFSAQEFSRNEKQVKSFLVHYQA